MTTKKKIVKKAAKKAVKKKITAKKTVKKAAKKAVKKKVAAKKTVKKAAKKAVKKKVTAKKTVKKAAKKTVKKAAKKIIKKTSLKKAPAKKALKKTTQKATKKAAPSAKKTVVARTDATDSNGEDKKVTPIVFSIDDVEALMATKKKDKPEKKTAATNKAAVVKKRVVEVDAQPVEKRVLGAASLADILGFNPSEKKASSTLEDSEVPKKWKQFYKLLLNLRNHVRDELDLHTADTLKHSSREESDISGYGNHQADAATDTFDRDFALSLVSSEQDALNEIEEAIQRIKNGSYGVCEVTGKAIPKDRLKAVPFARFSVEGQAEYEKNKRRKVNREGGNIFGDGTDAPKMANDDDE
ncbi:MAG: TraR/DksA family transcriptional regulator [Lentimonas sp.]